MSEAHDTTDAADPEDGIGRAFVIGSVVGFIVVFAAFGGAALAIGLEVVPSLGLALFVSIWGGPGFGGMMGAVVHNEHAGARVTVDAEATSLPVVHDDLGEVAPAA